MAPLTQKQEEQLDANETICIIAGESKFYVSPKDVYCYGEIDFSTNSEDLNIIAEFNWFDYINLRGASMVSDYNYEHHVAYSDIKCPRHFDTTRPDVISQYVHGCLGKPKRTIIFKHTKRK